MPCFEIILSGLLVLGLARVPVAMLTAMAFASFFALKANLWLRKSDADCGCTPGSQPHPVTRSDIVVASILVIAASVYFLLVVGSQSLPWQVTLAIGSLVIGVGAFLLGTILRRRWIIRGYSQPAFEVGGLAVGHTAPLLVGVDQAGKTIALKDYHGRRLVVAFIAPGCVACASTV